MKKILVLLAVCLVGVGSALTYHFFESVVHGAIDFVWYDTFNTDVNRWIILPLSLVFSLIFFGLQHFLDRKSETSEEEGLGNMPKPIFSNYGKVLLIGFFSLLAGAALGPEAILVPACMLLGGIVGAQVFKGQKQAVSLLAAAGLIALFTAFFHSFWVGLISIFLLLNKPGVKFKPIFLIVAALASGSSLLTLNLIEAQPYVQLPGGPFSLSVRNVIIGAFLVLAGYLVIALLGAIHNQADKLRKSKELQHWVVRAVIASVVLCALFFIGGPLVEFTGNKSISPMFEQASGLGLSGLLLILFVKIATISWSKAIGYRGGMIFPTIFLATVLVAIIQLYIPEFNVVFGVITVLVGAFLANTKNHVLA